VSYDDVELSEVLRSGEVQKLQIYEVEYTGKYQCGKMAYEIYTVAYYSSCPTAHL